MRRVLQVLVRIIEIKNAGNVAAAEVLLGATVRRETRGEGGRALRVSSAAAREGSRLLLQQPAFGIVLLPRSDRVSLWS